jgi:hypothetical protein
MPIVRSFAACCAPAASGHAAAAPPRSVAKNFRHLMWLATRLPRRREAWLRIFVI